MNGLSYREAIDRIYAIDEQIRNLKDEKKALCYFLKDEFTVPNGEKKSVVIDGMNVTVEATINTSVKYDELDQFFSSHPEYSDYKDRCFSIKAEAKAAYGKLEPKEKLIFASFVTEKEGQPTVKVKEYEALKKEKK